jgi:hypothetical protein
VLGPIAVLAACVVTAPLVVIDVAYLQGEYLKENHALGPGGTLGAADWLLVVAWTVEWIVNVYLWAVIVGSLVLTLSVLRQHAFRDPIERVLREKQYRPFLLMNAHGATLTLIFAAATIGYIAVAKGAASDYIGLWVTGGLVVLGFVPPYVVLKSRIGAVVQEEAAKLGTSLDRSTKALASAERKHDDELADVSARVALTLDMVRIDHLTRLHEELGKSEAQGLVLKLLVPAATGAWQLVKPFVGL